jgi:UDP-glucuronate decarboxylase
MIELAENVLRLTQSKSKLVRVPPPADDPKHRKPDIAKAKSVQGWEPKVQLEDGLKETITYFCHLLEE